MDLMIAFPFPLFGNGDFPCAIAAPFEASWSSGRWASNLQRCDEADEEEQCRYT